MNNRRSSEVTNNKKSRVKVLTLVPLAVLLMSALSTLWLITPTKEVLLTLISRSTSPKISLSFLNVLLVRDPNNRHIKLLIAKNIYQTGDIRRVIEFVEPLLNDANNNQDWRAYSLYLEAVVEGGYASDASLNSYSNQKVDLLFKNIKHIPDAKVARRFADVALSLNMPAQALSILTPHIASLETSYEELISLALQVSDYDTALTLLSASSGLSYDDTRVIRGAHVNTQYNKGTADKLARIHQIYRWQGSTTKAFEISLLLAAHEPTEQALRDGLSEAKALGDIYHEGLFYNQLAVRSQLTTAEYAPWLNALEKSQGTEAALTTLDKLRQENPGNRQFIIELARLYSYSSAHEQVISLHPQLKVNGPLIASETRRFANAYIMLNQPDDALAVLIEPTDWLEADDEYLQMVAVLAWDLSNKEVALATQHALIKRSDKHIDVYRYVRLHRPFSEYDVPELVALYRRTKNKTLLLEAMNVVANRVTKKLTSPHEVVSNEYGMGKLLDLALQNKTMNERADVYYYRAMYAIQQSRMRDGHRFFRLSLNAEPLFIPTINNYIWWAIEIQDRNTMRELYDSYSFVLKDHSALGLTFATLSQELAYHQHARYWYQEYLLVDEKTDITALIHYASLLTDMKLYEQANRLRFYIAIHHASSLAELPNHAVFQHALVGLSAGDAVAANLATKQVLMQPSASSVAQFFEYQLMTGNTDATRFWYQRTSLSHYTLPKSQLLAMEKHNQVPAQAEDITTRRDSAWIPALQYADNANQIPSQISSWQVEGGFYPQFTNYRSALRSQYIANTAWDINTVRLDYYQLAKFGNWQLSNYYQTADSTGVFASDNIEDEFRLRGLAHYWLNRSDWQFMFDFAEGVGEQRLGLNVNYSTQFNRRWRFELGAGINNDIRASQALALAGSDNVVNAGALYQPSYRTNVEFKANFHQLSTRFDDEIGDGWSGSLRVTEQLFFNSPAWQIYADYSMHEVNLSSTPLLGINDWHQGLTPLTSSDFISPRYQRLALGQRFYQGAVGISDSIKQFNYLSQPRYWFDSAVGYDLVTSQPVLLLGLGLGWPIFGHDELYFNVDWQSQDRNGEEAEKVSIGYFYSF